MGLPEIARLVLSIGLLVAVALVLGVFGYVGGSFLLMRAHTEARPWSAMLREAGREALWALLIQPLIPLYYLLGYRMGRGSGRPVVFVHGYSQNRVNFVWLARALGRGGLGPLYGFNYRWYQPIDASARRLGRFIEQICAETKQDEVDVVTHSMGGLVALEHLHLAKPPRVRRLVTIAGPHGGVSWRGPLLFTSGASMRRGAEFIVDRAGRAIAIPVLSVYSTHDNIVYPPATSSLLARGGRDAMVSGAGHLAILFDPQVAREVVTFLADAPGPRPPRLPHEEDGSAAN